MIILLSLLKAIENSLASTFWTDKFKTLGLGTCQLSNICAKRRRLTKCASKWKETSKCCICEPRAKWSQIFFIYIYIFCHRCQFRRCVWCLRRVLLFLSRYWLQNHNTHVCRNIPFRLINEWPFNSFGFESGPLQTKRRPPPLYIDDSALSGLFRPLKPSRVWTGRLAFTYLLNFSELLVDVVCIRACAYVLLIQHHTSGFTVGLWSLAPRLATRKANFMNVG